MGIAVWLTAMPRLRSRVKRKSESAVDALFFTRVSKPGRCNRTRYVHYYITVDGSPTSCSRQSPVDLALILHWRIYSNEQKIEAGRVRPASIFCSLGTS